MATGLFQRYRRFVDDALSMREPARDELYDWWREAQAARRPPRKPLADVLLTLSIVEADDPAHSWNLASALEPKGELPPAALALIRAAQLFDVEARTGRGLTGDEHEWAETAWSKAALQLVHANSPLAALLIASEQLSADQRDEVASAVRARLLRNGSREESAQQRPPESAPNP